MHALFAQRELKKEMKQSSYTGNRHSSSFRVKIPDSVRGDNMLAEPSQNALSLPVSGCPNFRNYAVTCYPCFMLMLRGMIIMQIVLYTKHVKRWQKPSVAQEKLILKSKILNLNY